jgi:hypothetical protein
LALFQVLAHSVAQRVAPSGTVVQTRQAVLVHHIEIADTDLV